MSQLKDALRNGALAGIGMAAVTQGAGMIAYTALGVPFKAFARGCINNLIWVTIGTFLLGSFIAYYYDSLPGSTFRTKMALTAGIGGFFIHLSSGLSPFTRPITKGLGWLPAEWAVPFNLLAFTTAGFLTALVVGYVLVDATLRSQQTGPGATAG